VALLGSADRHEAASLHSRMPEDVGIPAELPPAAVRAIGPAAAGRQALDRVGERHWVHLDVDVLDQREFPATDCPNSSGLSPNELEGLLRPRVHAPGLTGFSVGCYNPQLDPGGGCARDLVTLLGSALAP